jgi:hypothetical protein
MGKIFVNGIGSTHTTPMKSKADVVHALFEIFQDAGMPSTLHTDDAQEITSGVWDQIQRAHGTKQTIIEPCSPIQNNVKLCTRKLKKRVGFLR